MKFKIVSMAMAATVLVPAAAQAVPGPTITVIPTLAPNSYGSPSYTAWVDNSIAALREGTASHGTAGTPTYYEARDTVSSAQVVVTNFNSWLGQTDPGTVFGPAFANELGNRMTFGVRIDGNGSQFSIDQLAFSAVSTDTYLGAPYNGLGFGFGAGSYGYSNSYVGLLRGGDNILFTADDILVTGGAGNQLVDGLVGRGSGNSFEGLCTGCSLVDQQATIDGVAAFPGHDFTFTGTYSLGAASGSGIFTVTAPVPEPATWAMMIGGFGLAGAAMRRRRAATLSLA